MFHRVILGNIHVKTAIAPKPYDYISYITISNYKLQNLSATSIYIHKLLIYRTPPELITEGRTSQLISK